ncbi:MAG: TonB-dependent receptor [Bacteroidales bacterium]|nr:TonB-dependent receptor [Bacteroidales bacterium]
MISQWKRLLLFAFIVSIGLFNVLGQEGRVTGKVTSATDNSPIPGVNILIKNTTSGTVTDLDGNFSLMAGPSDILVISAIGFLTEEITVGTQTSINVSLVEDILELDEVVVIGYGTVRKRDLTGAVASVKGDALAEIPVSSVAEAMAGKLAGVNVVVTEGSPDAEINIRVRGGGSITQDNSPLYIVDGFPVNSISDVPASIIQSIDVLKDASSTAIYGARGANGVIIITTKGGAEGKVEVKYNAYYGFKKVANSLNSLSVEDYVKWQYEYALLNDNLENYEKYFGQYQDIDLYDGQPGTNWYDQVFGNIGTVFNNDLTINGGSEKIKYSLNYSGIYSDEIMLNSSYSRNNLSFKLDNNPNEKVELSFSLRYSDTKIGGAGSVDKGSNYTDPRVKQTMLYAPIPFNTLGEFADEEFSSNMINPLRAVADNDRQQHRTNYNMNGSFSWKIIKGLEFKTLAGLDYYLNTDDKFFGETTYYVKNNVTTDSQGLPALISVVQNRPVLRNTNILQYDFAEILGEDHSLNVLVGQEINLAKSNTIENDVEGFPSFFTADQAYKLVDQGFSRVYENKFAPDDKLISFFGRANYDFKNKYLVSATFRADGSSKFARGNRWGYFPSAAVAWRISEESFMESLSDVLNSLKLRLSYGTAGNNRIPTGQIDQVFSSSSTTYINNVSTYWSAGGEYMSNPDLKWETTYTRNMGLDFGLFRSALNGTIELYYNTTKDGLIRFPVSGTGYNYQYRNMGETENKGVELALNWVAVNKAKYGLNLGFNVGFNRNKIVSLGLMEDFGQETRWASSQIGNDYWVAVNGAVGRFYGYLNDGRYEVSDFSGYDDATDTWILNPGVSDNSGITGAVRPGTLKLIDIDGDGLVTTEDLTIIGNNNPLSTGGFNIDARFYGFDLSAVFNWSYGNDVYNANKIEYTTGRNQFTNMIDIMADGKRWTNLGADGTIVNDPAELEAMNANTTMWSPYMQNHVFTDWAVEDGSFLRLNTLTLGYTIPANITERVNIQRIRFYMSAYNVFILTNYSGFDPEVSTRTATPLTPGTDHSGYPKSRQLIFGLNLSF